MSQKQDHNDVDLENIDIDIHELDDIDIDNLHLYDELDGYGISGLFSNMQHAIHNILYHINYMFL